MRLSRFTQFSARFYVVFLLLIFGCAKDETTITPVPNIPLDLKEYVDRFVAEGKARNYPISPITIGSLKVQLSEQVFSGSYPVCGIGIKGSNPRVEIAKSCWEKASEADREVLMFHELGHALLSRDHLDTRFENGMQKSLMNSANIVGVYFQSTPALRSYYLDELFNPLTPTPSFALPKSNSAISLQDSISVNTTWVFTKTPVDLAHVGSVDGAIYSSWHHSLSIQSSSVAISGQGSYWKRSFPTAGIIGGSELLLKVKVKYMNISGKGIFLIVGVTKGSELVYFNSTLGIVTMTGTSDFSEYTVTIPYFPESSDMVDIFLGLDGTSSGTVFFDDVSVVNNF